MTQIREEEAPETQHVMSTTGHLPRITKVLAVPATGAGYYEDLAALHRDHVPLPERFTAEPLTPGFRAVREVAEAVSVGLALGDGRVAWGDCVAVSYSGKAGRDPLFRAEEGLATIRRAVVPALEGRKVTTFRELAVEVDNLTELVTQTRPLPAKEPEVDNQSRRALLAAPVRALQAARGKGQNTEQIAVRRRLHTAIRYGVSQALLKAVALVRGMTMAEIIAAEWNLPVPHRPVPIHAQSGAERYYNAERMIARRIASLPHALVDNVVDQVGVDGTELTRYIRWLATRIGQLGGEEYRPTIHLDLHGALGDICENQPGKMLGQLFAWEHAAQPYRLRIECPVLLESRESQIEAMKRLCLYTRLRKMSVQLVADDWANTLGDIHAFVEAEAANMIQIKMPDLGSVHNSIDAVLACKEADVGAFLGGSYAETDLSSKVAVHVALATQPDIVMAKPGMGVDEGISLVQNEMKRTLAQIQI